MLDIDMKIVRDDGFVTTIGDLEFGDLIRGPSGQAVRVVHAGVPVVNHHRIHFSITPFTRTNRDAQSEASNDRTKIELIVSREHRMLMLPGTCLCQIQQVINGKNDPYRVEWVVHCGPERTCDVVLSSEQHDALELPLDVPTVTPAEVRNAIDNMARTAHDEEFARCKHGECGGFRRSTRTLNSKTAAENLLRVLGSTSFADVVPTGLRRNELMLVRAHDLVATPRHGVYNHSYHVSAPTNVVEEAIIPWPADMLNDPFLAYAFGAYAGDGMCNSGGMCFADSDTECISHWDDFLARLNSDLPEEQHLHLHTTQETFNENTGVTYGQYLISLPNLNKGRRVANVWKEALKAASPLFYETKGEVPQMIRFGSLEVRCGFIGGFIDTDGCLSEQGYRIAQVGEPHRNLARHLYEICISIGLNTHMHLAQRRPAPRHPNPIRIAPNRWVIPKGPSLPALERFEDGLEEHPIFTISLSGPRIELLQPHIRISRKQIMFLKRDRNARHSLFIPAQPVEGQGFVRHIRVEGSLFQHESGLIVHDSHPSFLSWM